MDIPSDGIGEGLRKGDIVANRYKIRSLAGSGGMGQVYVAEDLKLKGKHWAVKEVRQVYAADVFLREAKIMSRLSHPCLPNIIDYFAPNEDGFAYLVMDYISGETVEQWFQRKKMEVTITEVLQIGLQLCSLFHYLHEHLEQPVVYRDVKPANVMLDELGQIRLIDFGIARMYSKNKNKDTLPLGTLHFAAPEQLEGRQTDPRTDLYSIGALMYYLLSRGKYFNVERKPLSHWRPDAPKVLIQAIDQLLQYDPKKRIQSALDLEQRLRTIERMYVDRNQEEGISALNDRKQSNSKIIVVGGLYRGAGATFTAIQLARLLNALNIVHNVTELTYNLPEHYELLNGEQTCPSDYVYYNERFDHARKESEFSEWTSGRTVWKPLRSVENALEKTSAFNIHTWLRSITEPVTIVDVSDRWEQPLIRELCEQADLICFVADPQKAKFNGLRARNNVKMALELREKVENVQFVANRFVASPHMKSWLKAFPWTPAGTIPNVEFERMLEFERKGKFVQDLPVLLHTCKKSLQQLVENIK